MRQKKKMVSFRVDPEVIEDLQEILSQRRQSKVYRNLTLTDLLCNAVAVYLNQYRSQRRRKEGKRVSQTSNPPCSVEVSSVSVSS